MPTWSSFKAVVYEIYEHRIQNAPEINGLINTTYLGLDEHLLCFFMMKCGERRLVERQLIEFLASLKYYADHFQRAKLYAVLGGFL